jgi:two-component system cell cycle sensor histidine kinase/response regulator CckA
MNEHTVKILVVEDNPVDAIRLKHDLTEINCKKCEFIHAETLNEALEFLNTEVFHLIMLDLGLPDTNGIDTLIGIQNSAADTPIVVMSGLDDESVAVEAVASSCCPAPPASYGL